MRERLQELRDCVVQLLGSRRFIAGAHVRSDAGAATPIGCDQAFLLFVSTLGTNIVSIGVGFALDVSPVERVY